MSYNNISKSLTEEEKQQALQHIEGLKTILNFMVNLTPEERKSLRKMGILRSGYVDEVFGAVKASPGSLPVSFSIPEYEKDVKLDSILRELFSAIKPLYDGLENTIMALGSECMKQSDEAYAHLKISGNRSQDQALNRTLKRIAEMHKKSPKVASGNEKKSA